MSELNFKSIKDVIAFAMSEEHDAHIYYTNQVKKAKSIELRMIWQQLANDEVRHEAILSDMLDKVEQNDEGSYSKKDMPDYVEVQFPEKEYSEIDQIIIDAIKKENEAYFMYKNLALKMTEEKYQNVLITMAMEEFNHKEALYKELNL